jgi:hypothetical protein
MKMLWGALVATLLAGAMAFAQDYQSSQDVNTAQQNDQFVSGGVTVDGNAAVSTESVEGVEAIHYETSSLPPEKHYGGSLLPDEDQCCVSGTLSSWDTSPTGVYKSAQDELGSPFPMAAAPAIDTGDRSLLPSRADLPPAMAGNLSSWDTSPTAVHKDAELLNGSPFPMSAAPPIRQGKSLMGSVDQDADFSVGTGQPFGDTSSPFPTAAAQPRRNWW